MLIAIAALTTAITADLPSIIPDDVPFVPTTSAAAAKALRWAHVGPQDTFFELGCGDGRVALEALRLGASVVCVEQDPKLAAQADAALQAELGKPSFHGSRTAKVVVGDVFDENIDLSGATVVYFFLSPHVAKRLQPLLSQLDTGARVISREFEIVGWPCGERFHHKAHGVDSLFLRWYLPPLGPDDHPHKFSSDPVQHLMDCAAEEGGEDDDERARVGRMHRTRAEEFADSPPSPPHSPPPPFPPLPGRGERIKSELR